MSKPTKEEKLSAYQTILYAIRFDLTEDRMWDMYSPGKKQVIEAEIARLETMCEKLLAPPAPRKPKASRKQDSKAQAETAQAVYKVVPAPDGLKNDSAIRKQVRK